MLLEARARVSAAGQASEEAAAKAVGEAETAAAHALMRVCGEAGRAEDALKLVYALKRDGVPLDASALSAYKNGKRAAAERGAAWHSAGGGAGLMRKGYERLLQLECCPERLGAPRKPGSIERIRIQW